MTTANKKMVKANAVSVARSMDLHKLAADAVRAVVCDKLSFVVAKVDGFDYTIATYPHPDMAGLVLKAVGL